ncbi:hypothetical protein EF912_09840 [Streptomyces sp. WAC07061]|uniref:hypothetical protein n=1 Tax=Streptomyces sp. WAC07061 TaxID=2487410 RepID=UPI000F798725|nr:hypothetical protein [Streptomyces sp. WAC07061]RSS60520.1 hypothetical protein EF912_09840 [Streptomyces sp. WAC07061]
MRQGHSSSRRSSSAFAFPLQLLAALIGFRVRHTAFATAMAVLATGWLVQGALLSAGPVAPRHRTT